ncbi:MAG: fibrobacter succinogenes major paralogous domain-containing protein, partial [bacterium]
MEKYKHGITLFIILATIIILFPRHANHYDDGIRFISYFNTWGAIDLVDLFSKLVFAFFVSILFQLYGSNIINQYKKRKNRRGTSVLIDDQTWTKENLNVDKYRNGEIIPEAKTNAEWIKAGEEGNPAWCYYNNDPENGKKYGKLYNWHAVNDPRGLAPEGWHIPTEAEFETLNITVGDDGDILKDASGFSALFAGYRNYGGYGGNFLELGDITRFRSS